MHEHPLIEVFNIKTMKFELYCSKCRQFFYVEG